MKSLTCWRRRYPPTGRCITSAGRTRRRAVAPAWGRRFWTSCCFPFRLVNALFEYLNFFSMTYSGKPLKTSGNARSKEMDMRRLMLMGNYVNALEVMKHSADQETPALVPSNWELVRCASGGAGQAEVLAKGVLSYDLEEDGSVLYSNGSAIFRVEDSRKPVLVLKGDLIEHVIAARLIPPPAQTP